MQEILVDLHDKYSFPSHTTMFTNSTMKVTIIKWTCPCGENMEK